MSDHFSQPGTPRTEIYQELAQLRLIDPHTHINPHSPASTTLADLLGYHYYTELARSAGMPKVQIEDPSIGPKELVERLVGGLGPIENTVQYSWLISICRMFFGFDEEKLHLNNWEALYDRSESIMASAQWPDMVLDQSNVEAVFLTNDFDDDLAGFDSDRYIPCLRTDDLVFNLADPAVRGRLAACTGIELDGTLTSLRASLRQRFEHFVGRGARACAISLPPSFTPTLVPDGRASTALNAVLKNGLTSQPNDKDALARRVFWTLAELCDEFGLPFDLMIGVNRKVYPDGVYQGQDLYDSRVSLIQYKDLFNAFPDVKFPVSVLASVTNQELVSYAWIFPNVYPNGHWWYSNTPSTITHDLAARLEAVPQTKMIGYYSDAYKLEFVWPKFDMYRKVLAGVLADQFVGDRGWSVERAVELGRQVLKDNTEEIFPRPTTPSHSDGIAANAIAGSAIAADAIDPDAIEVDDVELIDDVSMDSDDGPSVSDQLGSITTAAAATAAAVGASAMGLVDGDDDGDPEPEEPVAEEPVAEESIAEESIAEVEETLELEPIDEEPATLVSEVAGPADPIPVDAEAVAEELNLEEPTAEELAVEELASEDLNFEEPKDLEEPEETFDTVVIEPEAPAPEAPAPEAPAPEATAPEVPVLEDSAPELSVTEEIEPAEIDSIEVDDDEPVLPEPASLLDSDSMSEPASLVETAKETIEEVLESSDKVAADSLSIDPVPDDDEIGELDLDDVELIDPAGEAIPDGLSLAKELAAETDDEPLDVGNLLSDDDSPLDSDSPKSEPKIEPLRGETSFAPDEDSLQLKPDPSTGELTFNETDGDSDLSLTPSEESKTASTEVDDDEFNLEWLDESDDK